MTDRKIKMLARLDIIKDCAEVLNNYAETINDECTESYIRTTLFDINYYSNRITELIKSYITLEDESEDEPPFDPPYIIEESK